jgi:hypothetical protein
VRLERAHARTPRVGAATLLLTRYVATQEQRRRLWNEEAQGLPRRSSDAGSVRHAKVGAASFCSAAASRQILNCTGAAKQFAN